jgi:hypothetical protein
MPNARAACEAILFADQQRVVDADLAGVVQHILAEVDRDTDHFDAIGSAAPGT